MTNAVETYLKYANLQMAAEATNLTPGMTDVLLERALKGGNGRTNRFPDFLAKSFAQEWTVVDQKENTSGFSGTLFKNNITQELVISFRSTEFIDDSARDSKATNSLEIFQKGWAFGQIADMEKWYASLQESGKITYDSTFTVTGYSLGGHLATAFNLLHAGDRNSWGISPIAATRGIRVIWGIRSCLLQATIRTYKGSRHEQLLQTRSDGVACAGGGCARTRVNADRTGRQL